MVRMLDLLLLLVFFSPLPAPAATWHVDASVASPGDAPIPELRWHTFLVNTDVGDNALTAGCNYVLGVEIHQYTGARDDASFNLQLLLKYTE